MINIDGIEYRTAAQWEKKHRHVLKGQLKKGVERSWRSPNGNETMMFYSVEQTRPWAKKDVEAVNRRRRADAKAKREAEERERSEGAARAEQHRKDLLDCWGAHIDEETLQEGRRDHTAYQWCDLGFVPIAEARWRLTRYGGNSAWYYCSPWDVRYDPDRAKELWNGAARVRQAARRSSVRWASVVASVKTGRVKNPPRFVSGVDPPTCESCRPCFGGQHRQQG